MLRLSVARYHYQTRRDAERKYPRRVDVPVPEGGFGKRLKEMVEWCRERFTEWEHHGVTVPERDERGIAIDAVRFYFMDEIAAQQFRERWVPTETSGGAIGLRGTLVQATKPAEGENVQ